MNYEEQIKNFFQNEIKLMKIIGFNDERSYNSLINKIYKESQVYSNSKIYNEGFQLPSNIEAITVVQESIKNMNLNNLYNENITLTNNGELNYHIKNAIVNVLQPLILNNSFKNDMIKSNFVVKHIVWIYERINEFDWFNPKKPLIIYYGELENNELYHIQILNAIGFKVLYINSSRNISLNEYSKINEEVIQFDTVAPIKPIGIRISKGEDTKAMMNETPSNSNSIIKTWAKEAKEQIQNELYSNEGVFRPWQFKNGTTKPLYIDSVLEDIETYWKQDARFRPGFKVEGNSVYVPNFISKINGTYTDISRYKSLVDFTKGSKLTLFKEGVNLINRNYTNESMYSLMFTIDDYKVDYEKIKNHSLYKLKSINIDVQKLIINKINEFIELYKDKVEMKDILDTIATIITMSEDYANLIECFDFPFKVPKLVIYIFDRSNFDIRTGLFINYLNILGIDIIVYSPTGSVSIEDHMYGTPLNIITLDEMNFDLEYSKLMLIKIKEKTSIFKKFFK